MSRLASTTVTGVEEILDDLLTMKVDINGSNSKIIDAVSGAIASAAEKNWAAAHLEDVNGTPFVKDVGPVTVRKNSESCTISVQGEDVAFIEFGAGVHYNGAESYPGDRPAEVKGIGEFGKGRGKKDTWRFKDASGKWTTFGNPAFAPMYHAARAGEYKISKIAKEIFK